MLTTVVILFFVSGLNFAMVNPDLMVVHQKKKCFANVLPGLKDRKHAFTRGRCEDGPGKKHKCRSNNEGWIEPSFSTTTNYFRLQVGVELGGNFSIVREESGLTSER